ncbi:hypothetical protein [Aridibaculum aurantiacum]|uniref:hypothetical protein n=1 Tax=Aridibaculum aurantiacum TaxID=2810307 RepID=UPI001A956636|nr:hypothetical protein [Aridibaculum aurantiacum]
MKKIIIVAPHFPPSNLAAVHRSRLFAQHLPQFGWEPIIVTVDPDFYEEEKDPYLAETLPTNLRVEKVGALPVKPVRLVGDIGIRGFYQMYKRIVSIIKKEQIEFLYIPIPSHFAALLGRLVYARTKVPYGIDYIDPWVNTWPGTEIKYSKHWWSMKMADWLEPIAVKNASLITGVAPGYYSAVLDRNPHLKQQSVTAAMPYGGERSDHAYIKEKKIKPYLFEKSSSKIDLVYAGAMLPKAFGPLEQVLEQLKLHQADFSNVRFHFIGTGKSPNDPNGYNIKPIAEKFGLFGDLVFEYPKRIPYLDVLAHLEAADGAFILGSTEAHYTPSKVYQSVLSGKPILAVLHQDSTASKVIEATNSGLALTFAGENDLATIGSQFASKLSQYLELIKTFDSAQVDLQAFDEFSARNVTRILVEALEKVAEGGAR